MHQYYFATSGPFERCKFAFKVVASFLKTNVTSDQLRKK